MKDYKKKPINDLRYNTATRTLYHKNIDDESVSIRELKSRKDKSSSKIVELEKEIIRLRDIITSHNIPLN